MLLIMYQIFSSLLGHLPFSVHFLLHFYGVTFFGTPNTNKKTKMVQTLVIFTTYQGGLYDLLAIGPQFLLWKYVCVKYE